MIKLSIKSFTIKMVCYILYFINLKDWTHLQLRKLGLPASNNSSSDCMRDWIIRIDMYK